MATIEEAKAILERRKKLDVINRRLGRQTPSRQSENAILDDAGNRIGTRIVNPDGSIDELLATGTRSVSTPQSRQAATARAAEAKQNRPLIEKGARQVGLTARGATQGVAAPFAMAGNALGATFNKILELSGADYRFPEQSQAFAKVLSEVGLPETENEIENFAQRVVESVSGAGGFVKAGQALSSARNAVTSGVGKSLAASPTAQGIAGATGPAAGEIAKAAGAGPFTQGAAELVGSFVPGRRAKPPTPAAERATRSVAKANKAASELKELTGVDIGLSNPQRSQIPSELNKQRVVAQLDAGAEESLERLGSQNERARNLTDKLLQVLNPKANTDTIPSRFKNAAERLVQARKEYRTNQTSPLYREAFSENPDVDLQPVRELIKQKLKLSEEGSLAHSTYRKVASMLKGKATESGERETPSLEGLQRVKFELNRLIDRDPKTSAEEFIKGDLVEVKRALVDKMGEASPKFAAAEAEFMRLSPAVQELEESLIGRIAKLQPAQIKNFTREIFNPRTSPQAVLNARKLVEARPGGKQIWKDMVSSEMEFRVNSALEDIDVSKTAADAINNVPGLLRRNLFGAKGSHKRETLLRALEPEARKNMEYLDYLLSLAASGRAMGSDTAMKMRIIENLKGGVGVVKDLLTKPLSTVQTAGDNALFNRRVRKLTRSIYDPEYADKMRLLRNVDPRSSKAAQLIRQLIENSEADENQDASNAGSTLPNLTMGQ